MNTACSLFPSRFRGGLSDHASPPIYDCSCSAPAILMNIDDRLLKCWRNQDCGSCTHSRYGCGWCPYSSTCVPVSSLLQPLSDAQTCPLRSERFELRTRALGCGCSTTTFLTVVVTVFATITALLLIYGISIVARRLDRTFISGSWHGWQLQIDDDGLRSGRQWKRRTWKDTLASPFRGIGQATE